MKHSGRIKMLMILLLAGGIAVALIRPGRLYSLFILAGIGAVVVIFSIFELYSFYLPLQAAEDTLQNGENPKEVLGEIVDSAPDNPVGSLIRGIVQQSRADQDAEYYAKQIELTALQSQINPHFLYNFSGYDPRSGPDRREQGSRGNDQDTVFLLPVQHQPERGGCHTAR